MEDTMISPLARRLAEENSIDWRQIRGSGPDSRVIERDILMYLSRVMSGEAELPSQPDVSEGPPPSGLGEIHGFEDASARLAREGVDLADILGEAPSIPQPAYAAAQPAPMMHAQAAGPDAWAAAAASRGEDPQSSAVLEIDEPGPAIVPDLGHGLPKDPTVEEEVAVFELDLDDLLDEPAPYEARAEREEPADEARADLVDEMSLDHRDVDPRALDQQGTDAFLSPVPAEAAAPAEQDAPGENSSDATVLDESDFVDPAIALELDDKAHEDPAANVVLESGAAEPELATMPEPVIEPEVDAALAEPEQEPEQEMEPLEFLVDEQGDEATGENGVDHMDAAATDELAAMLAAPPEEVRDVSHEPAPVMAAHQDALPTPIPADAEPGPVPAGGTMLRRYFDAAALLDAQLQLTSALDGREPPLAIFLARAAHQALAELGGATGIALAMVHDDGLRGLNVPGLLGSFRDAARDLAAATDEPLEADLAVVDASELELDELVMPVPGALLTLGRLREGDELGGTLVLSGRFPARSGAAFLARVAGLLEAPIRLTV